VFEHPARTSNVDALELNFDNNNNKDSIMSDFNGNTSANVFSVFPRYILDIPGLTIDYLKVFGLIFNSLSGFSPSTNNKFFISDASKILGITENKVLKSITFFVNSGHLKIERGYMILTDLKN